MKSKENKKKEDLRVVKTKEIIRNTFKSMILEMDYDYITIIAWTICYLKYKTVMQIFLWKNRFLIQTSKI